MTEKNQEAERSCNTCLNKCMGMDMDPYCAAVNKPWGQTLTRPRPAECGPEYKLWVLYTRRR